MGTYQRIKRLTRQLGCRSSINLKLLPGSLIQGSQVVSGPDVMV